MRLSTPLAAVTLLATLSVFAPDAPAQESKLEVKSNDTVRSILERNVGKRVALVVANGPELSGVVTAVGDRLVHLSELSGRDFFDAAVALDHVVAVIVRVRGR